MPYENNTEPQETSAQQFGYYGPYYPPYPYAPYPYAPYPYQPFGYGFGSFLFPFLLGALLF
jgi:hypothetical protein